MVPRRPTSWPAAARGVRGPRRRVAGRQGLGLDACGQALDGAPWIGELKLGEAAAGTTDCVGLLAAAGPPLVIEGHPAEGGERAHACPWEALELDRILSHDVLGRLRGVNSFLTLLGREVGAAPSEQASEFLETASAAGVRTDVMVERLVTLLRLTRGRSPCATPLDDVVNRAVARSIDQFAGPTPALIVTSLPDVWASRDLLVECVTELVTNARKFAEDEV